jgi:hypothetical protein
MTETRVKLGSSFDPRMIPDDAWKFQRVAGDGLYKVYTYTDPALGITIEKKEYALEDALIAQNQHEADANHNRKWQDDTAMGQRVMRIPENVFWNNFAGRHNDPDFAEWFAEHADNQIYRTKRGKL